jgi:hypothetical protein
MIAMAAMKEEKQSFRHPQVLNASGRGPGDVCKATWGLSGLPAFDAMPTPRRRVDPTILRRVVDVIRRGRAIEIRYQSLTRDEPLRRCITPHAFGFDGLRWHVRAFCHIDPTFKDFILPRFLETGSESDPIVEPSADYVWNETASVVLVPHPQLSEGQKRAVALDFGMDGNSICISVGLALLYYFMKRLNLEGDPERRPAREQQLVVANKADLRSALKRASQQVPVAA